MNRFATPTPERHKGAALIIALILLMVMSLLGLSSIRTTSTQERMSANVYDRSLAFQTAENALRVGEQAADNWATGNVPIISSIPVDKDGAALPKDAQGNYLFGSCTDGSSDQSPCVSGLCQIPNPNCKSRWETALPWVSLGDSDKLGGMSGTSRYFVEVISGNAPCDPAAPTLNTNCKRFRITAESSDTGRATVILQSIYATD